MIHHRYETESSPIPLRRTVSRETVIAHRGEGATALKTVHESLLAKFGDGPENTLATFESALKSGANGIELDVYLTRDNEVVVIHDDRLNRKVAKADPKKTDLGLVGEKTFQELQLYDLGGGNRIPSLHQVIELVQSLNKGRDIIINIELKGLNVGVPTVELIKFYIAKGALTNNNVVYCSFNHDELAKIKKAYPEILISPNIKTLDLFDSVRMPGWYVDPYQKYCYEKTYKFLNGLLTQLNPDSNPEGTVYGLDLVLFDLRPELILYLLKNNIKALFLCTSDFRDENNIVIILPRLLQDKLGDKIKIYYKTDIPKAYLKQVELAEVIIEGFKSRLESFLKTYAHFYYYAELFEELDKYSDEETRSTIPQIKRLFDAKGCAQVFKCSLQQLFCHTRTVSESLIDNFKKELMNENHSTAFELGIGFFDRLWFMLKEFDITPNIKIPKIINREKIYTKKDIELPIIVSPHLIEVIKKFEGYQIPEPKINTGFFIPDSIMHIFGKPARASKTLPGLYRRLAEKPVSLERSSSTPLPERLAKKDITAAQPRIDTLMKPLTKKRSASLSEPSEITKEYSILPPFRFSQDAPVSDSGKKRKVSSAGLEEFFALTTDTLRVPEMSPEDSSRSCSPTTTSTHLNEAGLPYNEDDPSPPIIIQHGTFPTSSHEGVSSSSLSASRNPVHFTFPGFALPLTASKTHQTKTALSSQSTLAMQKKTAGYSFDADYNKAKPKRSLSLDSDFGVKY